MFSFNVIFFCLVEIEFEVDGIFDFVVLSRVWLKWSLFFDGKFEVEGFGSLLLLMVFVVVFSFFIVLILIDVIVDVSFFFGYFVCWLLFFVRLVNVDEVGWRFWSFCELLVGVSCFMVYWCKLIDVRNFILGWIILVRFNIWYIFVL